MNPAELADVIYFTEPLQSSEGLHVELIVKGVNGSTIWTPFDFEELFVFSNEVEDALIALERAESKAESEGESLAEHDRKESERTW